MKVNNKFLIGGLAAFVLLSGNVKAETIAVSKGSEQCGLPDSYDEDNYKDVGQLIHLDKKGFEWSSLQMMQITVTARIEKANAKDDANIDGFKSAVGYLVASAEGGDAYWGKTLAKGIEYDVVLYYPGGNPVGVIFAANTTKVLGYIEDSTVNCKK